MSRRVFRAECVIDASAQTVWTALTDFDRYPEWNPFTVEVRTPLEVGAPVDMRVHMSGWKMTLSQRETIRELRAPERLVWGMQMLGGLVRAERVQTIETLNHDPPRCRYVTEDTIEGPLGALVFGLFGGSLERGFRDVAEGLRAEVARRRDAVDPA